MWALGCGLCLKAFLQGSITTQTTEDPKLLALMPCFKPEQHNWFCSKHSAILSTALLVEPSSRFV